MIIEQIYTKCLAQGSYYIESNGEAIVIDPLRDVDKYISLANKSKSKIKYVIETHFHADFVSGHLTLSNLTGAQIIFGPNADPQFNAIIANDNQVFNFGNVSLTTIHTPGHTLESTSFLLKDETGKEYAIFTGDTLFLGDVGIPDVAQRYKGVSKEELAAILYDSVNDRIKPLPENILVYPAHGAGSACGKNMMKETVDTLKNQKLINYSINGTFSKEEFVKKLTDNLPEPPSYFPYNVKLNQQGYRDLDIVISKNLNPLKLKDFESINSSNVVLLDCRSPESFSKGFIKGSINIGLNGQFAPWVGAMLNPNDKLLIIADKGFELEAITRLARVGYENVIGFLDGGIDSYKGCLDTVVNNSPEEAKDKINKGHKYILDVRSFSERSNGYVTNSMHLALQDLPQKLSLLNKEDIFMIYCAGGYRSMIACSILLSNGFNNIINIEEGYVKLLKQDINITEGQSCLN
tara:strand:- start:5449 stop:6840 length:1392 start_codon:yes stop_codon:yes gene_type:complete